MFLESKSCNVTFNDRFMKFARALRFQADSSALAAAAARLARIKGPLSHQNAPKLTFLHLAYHAPLLAQTFGSGRGHPKEVSEGIWGVQIGVTWDVL